MNERIKELAEQAGGEFYSGFLGSFNTVKFREEDLAEFAELIVRECAKVANENVGAFTPGCGNAVLEHFGVDQ